jgi:hypothetical protein
VRDDDETAEAEEVAAAVRFRIEAAANPASRRSDEKPPELPSQR